MIDWARYLIDELKYGIDDYIINPLSVFEGGKTCRADDVFGIF
jgi:hypothetical protein